MLFLNASKGPGPIAVVGLGCWYPGIRGPRQLWENVLARRQEFRRIPDTRLNLADYHDPDPRVPDKTYGQRAAVIDGFAFDWAGMRIPQGTFLGTDIVQWLALEVARQALADAGYSRESMPRDRTGVILGNTLTGEHTRSNSLRLRWPFVRRALRAAAAARGLSPAVVQTLEATMEDMYKSVFPPITEDTLAGGLSNTIAGRICNYFDCHGGGYTVDGACSSSLLAVCTGANLLGSGDLDMALVGGVDISLDTFELIGFAKTGALTPDEMRVYDRRGNGFLPGEGCGFAVLKRLADARAAGDTIYAILRGWGISSDGKGGLTAPSRDGQATAIRRAYAKAGYGPGKLDFVEGHGTGTRVGDKTELEAVALALQEDGATAPRSCGMTSFKSIVGHTKAAAGIGAFIKAVIAVNRRILPPTAGCTQPNAVFDTTARNLYPLIEGEVRDPASTLRAGVSAMGFGGINSHVTLESGEAPSPRLAPSAAEQALLASAQETEVFVVGTASLNELRERIADLAQSAALVSVGELTDLAAKLAAECPAVASVRAAVIAGKPQELVDRLHELAEVLQQDLDDGETRISPRKDWLVSRGARPAGLGFLLPGQGSQQVGMASVLVHRYPWAQELVARADQWMQELGEPPLSPIMLRSLERAAQPEERDSWVRALAQSEVAQPAICLASLLYARYLERLGLRPTVVGGHSLGELTAFHLAGAFDEETLIKLAALRGRAMACGTTAGQPAGAMLSVACDRDTAQSLLAGVGGYVVVANVNSPRQTVVSGEGAAVADVQRNAESRTIPCRRLNVSNAFHSRLVETAAERLRTVTVLPEKLGALTSRLVSSMDAQPVMEGLNLRDHFAAQVLAPVDFIGLFEQMRQNCDLLLEVGPGRVLSGLAADMADTVSSNPPCLPIASQPGADRDLHRLLAQAFVGGMDVRWPVLYEGRLVRPFAAARDRVFIDNPCERPFKPAGASVASLDDAMPGGELETLIAHTSGAEPSEVQSYLARRGGFLAEVARADMISLNGSLAKLPVAGQATPAAPLTVAPSPREAAAKPQVAPASAPTAVHEEPTAVASNFESLLIDLAAERTGFPRETISLEAKLLDDLNLDSIKAAELVALAARKGGVAGKFDPSRLANATLGEVAAAIHAAGGERAASLPQASIVTPQVEVVDDSGSWVRNYVIDFVEAA
jgi:acyl transferase domain-containing protein